MEMIVNFINELDGLVWGWPMIILLLGTHIVMTVCTGGIQHGRSEQQSSISRDKGYRSRR